MFAVYALLALAACAFGYGNQAGGCADTWEVPGQCQQWAQMGECQKNHWFMNWRCKQSCGACGGNNNGGQQGGQQSGQGFYWPNFSQTSDGCYVQVNGYDWQCLQSMQSMQGSQDECLAACAANSQCKSVVVRQGSCDLYAEAINFSSRAPNSGMSGNTGNNGNYRFTVARAKRQTYGNNGNNGQCAPELCETNSGATYYELTGAGGECGGSTDAPTTTGAPGNCPSGQVDFLFTGPDGDQSICLDLPDTCQGPGYLVPESVLVGFAKAVYTVDSREECFLKCAEETSFDCAGVGSGLYFEEGADNCILNEETEATQPDQIAPNPGSDYFELRC